MRTTNKSLLSSADKVILILERDANQTSWKSDRSRMDSILAINPFLTPPPELTLLHLHISSLLPTSPPYPPDFPSPFSPPTCCPLSVVRPPMPSSVTVRFCASSSACCCLLSAFARCLSSVFSGSVVVLSSCEPSWPADLAWGFIDWAADSYLTIGRRVRGNCGREEWVGDSRRTGFVHLRDLFSLDFETWLVSRSERD